MSIVLTRCQQSTIILIVSATLAIREQLKDGKVQRINCRIFRRNQKYQVVKPRKQGIKKFFELAGL